MSTEIYFNIKENARELSIEAHGYRELVNDPYKLKNDTKKFAQENFPDIPELTVRVDQIQKDLGL